MIQPYVLIVEDDEWLADQFVRTLEAAGMEAKHVGHALAAMDTLDAHRTDVLVLDIFLPGPNAFALLHEIRSHSDLISLPIILCTNSAEQLKSEDLTAYGVAHILDKAIMKPDDLVAAVKRVIP